MIRSGLFSLAISILISNVTPPATGQTQFRRFTRTPYYTGPNDPGCSMHRLFPGRHVGFRFADAAARPDDRDRYRRSVSFPR
jgi:hypothetical protein